MSRSWIWGTSFAHSSQNVAFSNLEGSTNLPLFLGRGDICWANIFGTRVVLIAVQSGSGDTWDQQTLNPKMLGVQVQYGGGLPQAAENGVGHCQGNELSP